LASIEKLPEEIEKVGGRRALLVISPSVAKTVLLERIKSGAKCAAILLLRNEVGALWREKHMRQEFCIFVVFYSNT
jgi:hypothetical protein